MAIGIGSKPISAINLGGKTIVAIAKGSEQVWSYMKSIFENGVLAEGITVAGASVSGDALVAKADAEPDSSASATVSIQGIDVTDYEKLVFKMGVTKYVNYGSQSLHYGIDNATTPENTPETAYGSYTDVSYTLDVSALTGTHSLMFQLNADNDSSEGSWVAIVGIKIYEIVLV